MMQDSSSSGGSGCNRPPPSGFGVLARRIADWTTKLVLTAMILVMGVGVGRQMVSWWREESRPVTSPAPAWGGLAELGQTHDLQFGNQDWGLRRLSIVGNVTQARAVLQQSCRALLDEASDPPQMPSSSEQSLLAKLAAAQPIEQRPSQWRLYALPGEFPLVAGVRPASPASSPPGQTVAVSADRVVTWGVAVPISDSEWVAYVFYPQGRSARGSQVVSTHSESPGTATSNPSGREKPSRQAAWPSALSIPPGSQRILGMQAQGGAAVVAFRGSGPVESWMGHYDESFAQQDYRRVQAWREHDGAWFARFAGRGPQQGAISVQLARDRDGPWRGVLVALPPDQTERQ